MDYPRMAAETDRVEPAPRRIRGTLGDEQIFDTTSARYVWEWPNYPQYYIPFGDIDARFLVDESHSQRLRRGPARRFGLRAGGVERPGSVWVFDAGAVSGYARFDWTALDAWYEESERIFVHPRNPYVRVDAVRSDRHVRVSLDGVVLAETRTPVLLFETGLPTRYYIPRRDVSFARLTASPTETACPYKGVTSDYWSVGGADIAWSYTFPTAAVAAIADLVAFYNELVDIQVDGTLLARPHTHFVR
ncbi:DUF427 domain-containing protein [Asanoa iriomotensis]|uniref:DUF427 domain-containing protein n=1 Tax=Asanoa iriomotensis TaxID=234613 RepID=A0ABQ4CBT3_9ACTN|nr:DUF427 domain-containing protein [Asanoa iriomotensis]GIF60241.1 hypothetical protein Air01nite_63360 [Asanoa iriomotensis]